ncbi:formate dehydrogenase subunit delta [Methylomarinum sp. Ch1-1]|uniref:Formate dehydrogenase subunit delta n=1 Tax=Methylomarinum roseum TaxID=3067653 RepID=A0AAU7NXV8_9GAMM|nr:formate dehydrogenase subunit delta [Methylomarinum sp. Ch1-1]MDP4522540.1 formate dehydrogenase subunit delta [Methylomarinum sp. Ch1-1]
MDKLNLVKMANNIGAYFQSEPDREVAITGIEQHIRKFWEPRMRTQIIDYLKEDGSELMDIVAEAVRNLSVQK